MSNIVVDRIDCWHDTRSICEKMQLPHPSIKVFYDPTWTNLEKRRMSMVQFVNKDAIDLALELMVPGGPIPLVLNLADDNFAGGCVNQGSGAQEESLFRRTNYFQTLTDDFYPIEEDEAVYSPEVTVIKTSEASGWQLIPEEIRPILSFVACPGLKYPELEGENDFSDTKIDKEPRLLEEDVEILKRKIALVIQTAVQYKHDTIIFGALGCGAWRNPPKHVAEIFKYVLDSYDGVVLNYVFAILSTKDDNFIAQRKMDGNQPTCDVFKKVFGIM